MIKTASEIAETVLEKLAEEQLDPESARQQSIHKANPDMKIDFRSPRQQERANTLFKRMVDTAGSREPARNAQGTAYNDMTQREKIEYEGMKLTQPPGDVR